MKTPSIKPIVAVMRRTWLGRSETFIYSEMKHARHYERIVLTTKKVNSDLFPWPRVFMPADLPRFSPWWFHDRACRLIAGREVYFEKVCRENDVRLLHAHFAYDAVWTLPLKRRTGLPMVTTFHGADIYNPENVSRFRKSYERLFACGERFVVLGSRMLERAVALGCPRDRIRVVHLNVDMKEYLFSPHPLVEDKLRLLFCARLVEVKGLRYVIEALPLLAERKVPVELRVIGYADSPDIDYPALVERLGVADRVQFLGYQPPQRVREQMAEAHVFLQPSVTTQSGIIEGSHPTTLVEAQATGCPVIATRHSDIPEVVRDGETGWLVEEKRSEQIADRVQWFYQHPEALNEFGRRAREHVEQRYNTETEIAKLEQIYDELLKGVSR